ncbi:MAG: aldolase, partial [Acidobacteria bacterium]|nr:aldolase [Acidobacteriota bacterium]
ILLVGGPGAGKSSLAWACARAGLTFVADDATWLLRSEPVLLGRAQRMRFRPEALTLLPDLAAAPRIETVIGKHSFEIRTADVPNLATAARCRPGKVVFLNRQASGLAECRPISVEEARRRLAEATTLFEPRVWNEQEAARAELVREGALELRYSLLEDAVRRILEIA